MRTYLELGPVHAHVDSVIEGPPLEILFVIRVVDYVVQLLVNLGQPTKRDPWHIIRTTDGRKSVGLSQPSSISILSLAILAALLPVKIYARTYNFQTRKTLHTVVLRPLSCYILLLPTGHVYESTEQWREKNKTWPAMKKKTFRSDQ